MKMFRIQIRPEQKMDHRCELQSGHSLFVMHSGKRADSGADTDSEGRRIFQRLIFED